jgi:hypothetical protein
MKKYLIILLSIFFTACVDNKECVPYYIGVFQIDTNATGNPKWKEYVREFRWDTIKLISTADGHYKFNTLDKRIKDCEGNWFTTSNNIEGNCSGHIKQNNMATSFNSNPFDILIKISGEAYFLPFRKIK